MRTVSGCSSRAWGPPSGFGAAGSVESCDELEVGGEPNDAEAILQSAQVPATLFADDYSLFLDQRASLLSERAAQLVG